MLAPRVNSSLGPYVMECSGNGAFAAFGMLSAARWSGVPMSVVLAMAGVLPEATRVLVSGSDSYSQPQSGTSTSGASWIFTIAQLEEAGAFLALEMTASGQPYAPVDVCPKQSTNRAWTIGSHAWRPSAPGSYAIALTIDDPSIRARRLAAGFYQRTIDIAEV